MRDLFTSLRKPASLKKPLLGAALGAVFGLLAFGQAAEAANPLELNFWLSGPKYDGRVASCESALGTITSQFHEKESTYWNSALKIVGFDAIRETAFRPWASETIPRRWCAGYAQVSDGHRRAVYYQIEEDEGIIGASWGVEFCVVGLDRNWAFNPACKMARP